MSTPCPDCGTSIFFEPHMLLSGAKFSCSKCQASIGLASESAPLVQQSLEKFSKLKSEVLKTKESLSNV